MCKTLRAWQKKGRKIVPRRSNVSCVISKCPEYIEGRKMGYFYYPVIFDYPVVFSKPCVQHDRIIEEALYGE